MNSKYYKAIAILHRLSLLKRRVSLPFKLISSGFLRSESFFPELERKSRIRILFDLLAHIWKYGSIEWHYFSYGFDIKGFRKQFDYLDDSDFLWKASMLNTVLPERDCTCILRDKHLFSLFLTAWGFRSPREVGVLNQTEGDKTVLDRVFIHDGDYFFKPIDGQCGSGVFELKVSENRVCLGNGKMIEKEDVTKLIGGGISFRIKYASIL